MNDGFVCGLVVVVEIYAAENIGFNSYPPAYLSPQAKGKRLLTGANFASASSGYYDKTAAIYVSTVTRVL